MSDTCIPDHIRLIRTDRLFHRLESWRIVGRRKLKQSGFTHEWFREMDSIQRECFLMEQELTIRRLRLSPKTRVDWLPQYDKHVRRRRY